MAKSQFELIIGPSDQYYYFQEDILKRIEQSGPFEYDFIYFLPVKRAVRYFKEMLIAESPHQVLAEPPVFTFYEFMVQVYRKLPHTRKVISPAMRLFLIEESLKKRVRDLRFFTATSARRRGLVTKVDALINELREYGYSADLLLQSMEEEEEDHRLHDFALLIDTFRESLGERLIDEAGAIQEVVARLDAEGRFWREQFPRVTVIYLSGYGLFSRPMIRFFERLRNVCSINIKLDYLSEYPQLFFHVDPAYRELEKLQPLIRQKKTPQPWETHLFGRKSTPNPLPLNKDVLIQPVNHRSQEVAFIANYVKRLHFHLKIPLHEIGITFPSLEQYAPLIHEIFPRYGLPDTGLPYNLSTGFQLSQSPLIRSFLLFLEVPLQQYEVKKLQQLIGSPFFRPPDNLRIDMGAVKLLARELRLTHLHRKWEKVLDKHLEYLQRQIESAAGEEEFDLRRNRETLSALKAVRSPLKHLLQQLEQLEASQAVGDFRRQFLALLEIFGFLDWYKTVNSHLSPQEKEKEYRAFNRFVKLLDQFSWIVSNLHGDQPLSLKDFQQYLSLLVSQATYNLREWSNYGLQIMPRLEILAVQPRVLIFGGMVEGDFPRPFTQDVFFHDEERERLGLAATEDLLAQDRYLFYQVLSSPVERLVFTYPRFQKEAARVPSNFLNVLADQTAVRWRKNVPSELFLQNQNQLLEQVACRLPAGISDAQRRKLQRWWQLNLHNSEKREMVRFWRQRVRSGYEKRRRDTFTEYEGILNRYPGIVEQLRERFREGPFSITRLETFAFCPIRFFFRYVLYLEEEAPLETGLTPRERGDLVHKTLFRFYRTLREQNREKVPWEAASLLRRIAEEEFAQLPFQGMLFDLEREKYFGSGNYPGLWDVFLQQEAEYFQQERFYPAFFEVAFGRAGRASEQDPLLPDTPAIELHYQGETLHITGKVDRIDLDEQGQVLLLDYKTGASGSTAMTVLNGLDLQLPVYALVLPELLDSVRPGESLQPVMTAIYQVQDADNCRRHPVMYDREAVRKVPGSPRSALPNRHIVDEDGRELSFEELLDRSRRFLFSYAERIRQGTYRHTAYPEERLCAEFCEFRRMCRKDVRKLLEYRGPENDPSPPS